MANLFRGIESGANYQAEAVKCYLQLYDGIEDSYDAEMCRYTAEPQIERWHNCREQGYIISLRSADFKRQINIAFFEHRNSDHIDAVKWEQVSLSNAPLNIDTAFFGDVYQSKWDTSFQVPFGAAAEMAEWIYEQLVAFWRETTQ